jgi:hypothetical protein
MSTSSSNTFANGRQATGSYKSMSPMPFAASHQQTPATAAVAAAAAPMGTRNDENVFHNIGHHGNSVSSSDE